MRKVAFEFKPQKAGDFVFPINLTKTGFLAVVNGKTFLEHSGIKYAEKSRSFYARPTTIHESGPGYKRTWSGVKGIEIKLEEYIAD
ncbi:hypothetical protein HY772_08815 [Candidatus Woesearchaeota archaeon]|nr:hypothetical protein [Candidatus Woesearchaeota archaeon]